ncbi:MAG: hypothetical protein JWN95_1855 [Frankiales bacterium]|nr:hypothetical protein [Frankiales bacterium]
MTSLNPNPQLIDGVDVDAVAAAVRSCDGVDDLDAGQLGSAMSYLPGRRVAGVQVAADRVTVQVRTRWAVPVGDVGRRLQVTVGPLVAPRRLDVVVSDIADPPTNEAVPWTSSSDDARDALSSASTTLIAAETSITSSSDSPLSTSSPSTVPL